MYDCIDKVGFMKTILLKCVIMVFFSSGDGTSKSSKFNVDNVKMPSTVEIFFC